MKVSDNLNDVKFEYKRHLQEYSGKSVRPVWYVFSGLGGQWPAMAQSLMVCKVFAHTIDECHKALLEFNFDLKSQLLSTDPKCMDTMLMKICGNVALQIALIELLKSLDIKPDGIIGHSFGEIAAGYADGCLTLREAMIVGYFRGIITQTDKQLPKGLMAVVGLSKEKATERCVRKGVEVVCYNGPKSVVISGIFSLYML